jgi:hypothetical protein
MRENEEVEAAKQHLRTLTAEVLAARSAFQLGKTDFTRKELISMRRRLVLLCHPDRDVNRLFEMLLR